VLAGGSRFAPNFIQNLYTVLKKRLWESRSTPTLAEVSTVQKWTGHYYVMFRRNI
jgi:hypothetical protein